MKIRLLDIDKLIEVDREEDPLRYYKTPGLNLIYFKRLELVSKIIGDNKYDKLLDIGYGSGIFLPELYKKCKKLYGIDKHGKSSIIGRILKDMNIEAELTDSNLLKMPYNKEMFDCVTCISVLDPGIYESS